MTPAGRIKALQNAIRRIERAMPDVGMAGPFYELKQASDELYRLLEDARADEAESPPKQEALPL
jgi:hypothetical protein